MPFLTLAATPTQGRAEVLKALQYLKAFPLRKYWKADEIAEAVQPLLQLYGKGRETATVTAVSTVLGLLVADSPATVATNGSGGYRLTLAGVLAARRARPFALRP